MPITSPSAATNALLFMQWSPDGLRNAAAILQNVSDQADKLVLDFTNSTSDLALAWGGHSGAEAQRAAHWVAVGVEHLVRSYASAAQITSKAAADLQGLQDEMRAVQTAAKSYNMDMSPDGVITPPKTAPNMMPGVTPIAPLVDTAHVNELSSKVNDILTRVHAFDARLAAQFSDSMAITPGTGNWITVESARLQGHLDASVVNVLALANGAFNPSLPFEGSYKYGELMQELTKLNADQLQQFFTLLPQDQANKWAAVAAQTTQGDADPNSIWGLFFPTKPSDEYLAMVNHVTATVDPETWSELIRKTPFFEPNINGYLDRKASGNFNQEATYTFQVGNLYSGRVNGPAGPQPTDIQQTALGDCYYVATLAAIAQAHPELLNIKQNKNGSATVTFYKDGQPKEITVSSFVPRVGKDEVASQVKGGDWVLEYEKAFAQLNGKFDAIANGGFPTDVIPLVAGPKTSSSWLDSNNLTVQDLQSRVDQKQILVAASQAPETVKTPQGDIPSPHAFSISHVDPVQRTVTVRNPWADNAGGGEMTFSFEEFQKYFPIVAAGVVSN